MQNVIERIARHADTDTRCAMGFDIDTRVKLRFPPRKLPLPHLNLHFQYDRRIINRIKLTNAYVYNCRRRFAFAWVFNEKSHYILYKCGKVSVYIDKWEHHRHPDINEDGTLREWRT